MNSQAQRIIALVVPYPTQGYELEADPSVIVNLTSTQGKPSTRPESTNDARKNPLVNAFNLHA